METQRRIPDWAQRGRCLKRWRWFRANQGRISRSRCESALQEADDAAEGREMGRSAGSMETKAAASASGDARRERRMRRTGGWAGLEMGGEQRQLRMEREAARTVKVEFVERPVTTAARGSCLIGRGRKTQKKKRKKKGREQDPGCTRKLGGTAVPYCSLYVVAGHLRLYGTVGPAALSCRAVIGRWAIPTVSGVGQLGFCLTSAEGPPESRGRWAL